MFEDIDAENSVPTLAGRKVARGAVNDLMLREFFLMLRTKSRLRFDGHNAPNLVKPDKQFRYLANTSAHLGHAPAQELPKLGQQSVAIIYGFIEGGKFEVTGA